MQKIVIDTNVTYPTNFTFSTYKQTKIVTPREYWENYKPD